MLATARRQYAEQVRITEYAVRQARRQVRRGVRAAARTVASYQSEAVGLSLSSATALLTEQGIASATTGQRVATGALLTAPARTVSLIEKVATDAAFERLIAAMVNDAGRTAALVDLARRPAVTGYVRSLIPPSCGRCAVLAGRVYRYSTGFQRHPKCDCLMTPTDQTIGPSLVLNPTEAVEKGWVHGLSKADQAALDEGADIGQVVNVRRRSAGLKVGSSVAMRRGRLTPEGCAIYSTDRDDFVRLLTKFGYLT